MLFRCRGRRDSDIPRPHHVTQREDDVAAGENAAYASERRIAEKERAKRERPLLISASVCPSPSLLLLSVRARGLESEQRRIRLRRGALTLLLGMLLRTFDFRGKAAGSLRKKCRLYGEGLSPPFVERSGGDIPLSRPLPRSLPVPIYFFRSL